MDDLFKIYINFPVPAFSYLPFITLLPIPPDSYRDKAEERLLKVCASVVENKNCTSPSCASRALAMPVLEFSNHQFVTL
jgi:hypothetical protein